MISQKRSVPKAVRPWPTARHLFDIPGNEKIAAFLGTVNAPFYDVEAALMGFSEGSPWRRAAVDALGLRRGARVLDVGCGTGLNFKLIEEQIGPQGHIVGVDMTKGMLGRARERMMHHGWDNVELVNENIERYKPKGHFDAVLCTFVLEAVHRYKAVIDHLLGLLTAGGTIAIMGTKLTAKMPLSVLNIPYLALCKVGGLNLERDIPAHLGFRFSRIAYREFWGGFCYLISASHADIKSL